MTGRTLAFLMAALPACATVPPLPKPTAELPLAAWERQAAPGTELGAAPSSARSSAPSLAKTVTVPSSGLPPSVPLAPIATSAASPIPGGPECISELRSRNIAFRPNAPVLGVATPVVLTGPLHGIRFYAPDKRPFLADCRLLLALDEIAPELTALGVTDVRFSGAYVYKLTHPGRLSMHALGLAADLHAFHVRGTTLEVKRDFAHGRGCAANIPLLNFALCRISAHGIFKEHLGPDDNSAHFDHFHLGLKPLPGEVAEDLPVPAPAPRHPARSSKSQHKR